MADRKLVLKVFGTQEGHKLLSQLYLDYCDVPLIADTELLTGHRIGQSELIRDIMRIVYGKDVGSPKTYSNILND